MFGLTVSIRKSWAKVTSTGPAWPSDVEYPGSLRMAILSFFTGRLPGFLVSSGGTIEEIR
jgi:hypothetical protein